MKHRPLKLQLDLWTYAQLELQITFGHTSISSYFIEKETKIKDPQSHTIT